MIKPNKPKAKSSNSISKEKRITNQVYGFSSVNYCLPATVVVRCFDCSLLVLHQKAFQHQSQGSDKTKQKKQSIVAGRRDDYFLHYPIKKTKDNINPTLRNHQ